MGTMHDLMRIPAEEIGTRPKMIAWCVAAAFTISAPAWAGTFQIDSSYTLGNGQNGVGPGVNTANDGVVAGPGTPIIVFPTIGGGFDHLQFTGAGSNNIGIHTYGQENQNGFTTFGSRSSGQGTYFVDGRVIFKTSGDFNTFQFSFDGGEVSAIGSTGFVAGDYQLASMTVRITDAYTYDFDDGQGNAGTGMGTQTLIDYALSINVGTGGALTLLSADTGDVGFSGIGAINQSIGAGFTGFASFFYSGGFQSLNLITAAGIMPPAGMVTGINHNIIYELATVAAGNLTTAASCLGAVSNFPVGLEVAAAVIGGGEGGYGDAAFPAICGAGAQSGDPLGPAIRVPVSNVPVPGSETLVGLGLAALALSRLRQRKKAKHA